MMHKVLGESSGGLRHNVLVDEREGRYVCTYVRMFMLLVFHCLCRVARPSPPPPLLVPVALVQVLNVGANQITSLKPLSTCPTLQAIIANDNLLDSLAGLGPLEALNTLVLSKNKLEHLDEDALGISPAERQIAKLNTRVLRSLRSLTKLSLSYNNIHVLPKALKNCQLLQELRLPHNRIQVLPEEVFVVLGRLRTLDLSHNRVHRWKDVEVARYGDDEFGVLSLYIERDL